MLADGDFGVSGYEICQRREALSQSWILVVTQEGCVACSHRGLHVVRREPSSPDCVIAGVVVLLRSESIPSEHEGAIHVEKDSFVAFEGWVYYLVHIAREQAALEGA